MIAETVITLLKIAAEKYEIFKLDTGPRLQHSARYLILVLVLQLLFSIYYKSSTKITSLTFQDIYVGAVVNFRSHQFVITDADEYALSYAEQHKVFS